MKTNKSVERSPIQMMIVSFVIIFAFITGTILFMYFKWFASEELGAPAAVNVVGEKVFSGEKKNDKISFFKERVSSQVELHSSAANEKVLPLRAECFVLTSLKTADGSNIVYMEICDDAAQLLAYNLSTEKSTLIDEFDISAMFVYVPVYLDKINKIILEYVSLGDGGGPAPLSSPFIIFDLNNGEKKTFDIYGYHNCLIIFTDPSYYIVYAEPTDADSDCAINNQLVFYDVAKDQKEILVSDENVHYIPSDYFWRESNDGMKTLQILYQATKGSFPADLSDNGMECFQSMETYVDLIDVE